MKIVRAIELGLVVLLLGLVAFAQEFPRYEVGVDYSYARFNPNAAYTQAKSLNGGGGSFDININEYLGIKMDLQGYGSNKTNFNITPNPRFPSGASGVVSGNLFTYMFGPQIKIRAHGFHPFVHYLLGGAHSNVYHNAYGTLCQPIVGGCAFQGAPAENAFAMMFGGGVDIPLHHVVEFRPVEIDYLYSHFTNQFANSNQNNFRYSAGLVFNFGHTTY